MAEVKPTKKVDFSISEIIEEVEPQLPPAPPPSPSSSVNSIPPKDPPKLVLWACVGALILTVLVISAFRIAEDAIDLCPEHVVLRGDKILYNTSFNSSTDMCMYESDPPPYTFPVYWRLFKKGLGIKVDDGPLTPKNLTPPHYIPYMGPIGH